MQERGSTPINTYLFIEKVVSSERADADLMSYGIATQLQAVQQQVYEDETNDQDYSSLEVESIKTELISAQESLKKLTHENHVLQRERDSTYHKIHHLNEMHKSTISDMLHREEFLIDKVFKLLQEITSLKSPTAGANSNQLIKCNYLLHTKAENVYNQAIQELYYKLLVDQIPPAKVERIIKSVLNCFIPTLNTSD